MILGYSFNNRKGENIKKYFNEIDTIIINIVINNRRGAMGRLTIISMSCGQLH